MVFLCRDWCFVNSLHSCFLFPMFIRKRKEKNSEVLRLKCAVLSPHYNYLLLLRNTNPGLPGGGSSQPFSDKFSDGNKRRWRDDSARSKTRWGCDAVGAGADCWLLPVCSEGGRSLPSASHPRDAAPGLLLGILGRALRMKNLFTSTVCIPFMANCCSACPSRLQHGLLPDQ